MSPGFFQLRHVLTQVSALTPAEQMGFVLTANAAAENLVKHPALEDVNSVARNLLAPAASVSDIRWLRWSGDCGSSGVALSLCSGNRNYLLLPEKTDPPHLRLEASLIDDRYDLFPNLETLAKANGAPLAYIHRNQLRTLPRPADDAKRFARLLRMANGGAVPPFPTFRHDKKNGTSYWIEERHGGVHWSIMGIQKGLEYVLGEVREGSHPLSSIALEGAASAYPLYSSALADAPDLKDALPEERCFDAGDPRYFPATKSVNGMRVLRNAEGTAVGWARLIAGGAEGRFVDQDSGLSGATSAGGRPNQEDGLYLAHFRTHDGKEADVLVVADGLGGNELGEVASGGGLKGVHAAVVRALRDQTIPLAGDLYHEAREALEAQVLFEEMKSGVAFSSHTAPNTVFLAAVIVDGDATLASAGDAIALLCARDEAGRLQVLGHTLVDAHSENSVTNTLALGSPRLYRTRIPKGSWLALLTDGAAGGLMPAYKRHASKDYRQDTFSSYADQSLFHRILHVLDHAPASAAGPALFDAASGSKAVPSDSGEPDDSKTYPGLAGVTADTDNWTAAAFHAREEPKPFGLAVPASYGFLENVYPAQQYVYEEGPYALYLHPALSELWLGSQLHPQGAPMVVWSDDGKLAPLHARIQRVVENGQEAFFLEKVTGYGRIVLLDDRDEKVAALTRKGARHEIKPGHLVRLTPRTFFRFR